MDHLYVHVRTALEYPVPLNPALLCGASPIEMSVRHDDASNWTFAGDNLNDKEEWCPKCLEHPKHDLLLLAETDL